MRRETSLSFLTGLRARSRQRQAYWRITWTASVFVIMAKRSPKPVIKKSTESLGRDKILGIVFNGYTKAYKSYDRYYRKYYKKEEM